MFLFYQKLFYAYLCMTISIQKKSKSVPYLIKLYKYSPNLIGICLSALQLEKGDIINGHSSDCYCSRNIISCWEYKLLDKPEI